jgi:pilus assembly protein Flp/PilA
MKKSFQREKGQGLVEYALILVLMAIVVIAVLLLLGPQLRLVFLRIALELQEPGKFSGSPVYVQSISVTASANCNPITHECANVQATATVSLVDDGGGSVSARTHVYFVNEGGNSRVMGSDTGTIHSGNLGGGQSGNSVEACVIAVNDHSLVGGYQGASTCDSDSY